MHFSPPFMCCCSTSSRKACNPYLLSLCNKCVQEFSCIVLDQLRWVLCHRDGWNIETTLQQTENISQKRRKKLHGLAWWESPWVGVYCNLRFLFEAWLQWSKKLVLFFLSSWVCLWQWEIKESQPSCSMYRWWQEMQHLYPNTMHLLMSFCKCAANPHTHNQQCFFMKTLIFSFCNHFTISKTRSSQNRLQYFFSQIFIIPFLVMMGSKNKMQIGFLAFNRVENTIGFSPLSLLHMFDSLPVSVNSPFCSIHL